MAVNSLKYVALSQRLDRQVTAVVAVRWLRIRIPFQSSNPLCALCELAHSLCFIRSTNWKSFRRLTVQPKLLKVEGFEFTVAVNSNIEGSILCRNTSSAGSAGSVTTAAHGARVICVVAVTRVAFGIVLAAAFAICGMLLKSVLVLILGSFVKLAVSSIIIVRSAHAPDATMSTVIKLASRLRSSSTSPSFFLCEVNRVECAAFGIPMRNLTAVVCMISFTLLMCRNRARSVTCGTAQILAL